MKVTFLVSVGALLSLLLISVRSLDRSKCRGLALEGRSRVYRKVVEIKGHLKWEFSSNF